MPTYLHPGVYIEEIPSGVKPIEGVGTSTAAFVGYTTKGPIGEPILILNFDDYDREFGGIRDLGNLQKGDPMGFSVSGFYNNGGSKTYVVRVVREGTAFKSEGFVLHPDNGDQLLKISAVNEGLWGDDIRIKLEPKEADPTLYVLQVGYSDGDKFTVQESITDLSFDAEDPRYIENKVNNASQFVTVDVIDADKFQMGTSTSESDLSGLTLANLNEKTMSVKVGGESPVTVTFAAGTFDGTSNLDDVADAIETAVRGSVTADANPRKEFTAEVDDQNRLVLTSGLNGTSAAVVVTGTVDPADDASILLKLGVANEGEELTGAQTLSAILSAIDDLIPLSGGLNGDEPNLDDYKAVFSKFVKIRDINIICLPGQSWPTKENIDNNIFEGKPVIEEAISHAESTQSRMVIVDPPFSSDEIRTEKQVSDLSLPTSTYSVLYYPWLKVVNPFFNTDTGPGNPKTLYIPPSGLAAGIWAKTDGRRGVWKAPAGVETGLLGIAGLQHTIEDLEQDQLNPVGVNALRTLPNFGNVIWGSRTLATNSDPEWRYTPVRRTAIMIEQSIYGGIQWAVFEPNDHRLWAGLRSNLDSFMNGLFRAGAFQGEKASDAYFVRCGLGDTMTQGDIDRGQVIVIVGFAPLKPAEFVIVRIQQKVGQTE